MEQMKNKSRNIKEKFHDIKFFINEIFSFASDENGIFSIELQLTVYASNVSRFHRFPANEY